MTRTGRSSDLNTKNLKTIRFIEPHKTQETITKSKARFRVVACGRRFGKTEIGKREIVLQAAHGARCWWLSPTYPMASQVWRDLKEMVKNVKKLEVNEAERRLDFPNGGSIAIRSTFYADLLRGAGLVFAVLDEAAFMEPTVWPEVVRPMLLEKRGTPEDPPQMTFMLRRRPFTPAEVEQVLAWSEARPVIVPGRPAEAPYDALLSGRQTLAEYEAAAPRLVGPVFDDRPFYFAQYKPWGVPRTMLRSIGVIVLPLFGVLAVLVAVGRPRDGGGPAYAASVAYFACLGVGFIMVELCLLQNLTLLLGHPIFTLSILLFTLLAAGGLGSAFSARFERRKVCLTVAGLGVLYALALPVLVPALLPLPLFARIAVAVALVGPLGFAMGMPFPAGLGRVGQGPFPAAPFYWGLNGIFSVVGSLATMVIAVVSGFTWAMIGGAICYLVAAGASRVFAGPRLQVD